MPGCPDRRPDLEYQLGWEGGPYGYANCTACAAAMAADAHTCGKFESLTGAMVRAATNEARPDPASPGLNLPQVDSAVFELTNGEVNLDTRVGGDAIAASAAYTKVRGGAWMILQVARGSLVDDGWGGGNGFRGGHAVIVGFDQARQRFVMGDPLIKIWLLPTWAALSRAAARLVTGSSGSVVGTGRMYASFTRDVVPSGYRIDFEGGEPFLTYRVEKVGEVLCIVGSSKRRAASSDTTRLATRKLTYRWSPADVQRRPELAGKVRVLSKLTTGDIAKSSHPYVAIPQDALTYRELLP